MAKGRKQISFDLDTKMLKKYYPSSNWRKAYEDIKEFMYDNNFSWIQGSVYTSNKGMSNYGIRVLLTLILDLFPYLNFSIRDIVVTNIGKSHNYNYLLNSNTKLDDISTIENTSQLEKYLNSNLDDAFKNLQQTHVSEYIDEFDLEL